MEGRSAEFQVVIAIEVDDGRLFPLTETNPVSLLPIAGRSLLRTQLATLETMGATDVLIVTPKNYKTQLNDSLWDYTCESMNVELIPIEDDEFQGTADCLRRIHDRIRNDFIFISCDVLFQFNLAELINYHRTNAADLTIALAACKIEEPQKKGGAKKIVVDEDDQEYTAVCKNGRLVLKNKTLEIERFLSLSKALLAKNTSVRLRTDLVDSGLYVFSKWVIDLVMEKKNMTSVKFEVVPYLIERQFQSKDYLLEIMPSISNRFRSARGIDRWIAKKENEHNYLKRQLYFAKKNGEEELNNILSNNNNGKMNSSDVILSSSPSRSSPIRSLNNENLNKNANKSLRSMELSDYILQDLSCSIATSNSNSANNMNDLSQDEINEIPGGIVLSDSHMNYEEDMIRCFSFICEYSANGETGLLQNITTLQSYLSLNRDIPMQKGSFAAKVLNYHLKEQSVLGEGLQMEDKVTIKECSVGQKCSIGAKTRLNKCVIMDNVKIGQGCTIQDTIICSGVVIGDNCSLDKCQFGKGAVVLSQSKIKSEAITANDQVLLK